MEADEMNKVRIFFHLKDSKDALERLINEMESDPGYDYGNYIVDMRHIYHHLNTAWNSRDASNKQVRPVTDQDFNKWQHFPTDLPMFDLE
jgi:hypothetical protein